MGERTDYTHELAYITQLITSLEYIVGVLEKAVPRYPEFRKLVSALLDGTLIKCSSCGGVLSGDGGMPIHGLREQIDELYEVMAVLEAEVAFELGGGDDASDSGSFDNQDSEG